MEGEQQLASIVMDCGSSMTRIGIAGEQARLITFPSVFGTEIRDSRKSSVGDDVTKKRGNTRNVTQVYTDGVSAMNMDHMCKIWDHAFTQLNVDSTERSVLLTESVLTSQFTRQQVVHRMFEQWNVPALYLGCSAVLSMYGTIGATTGLVYESGLRASHAVPIYEGYMIRDAVRTAYIGGEDMTHYLSRLLNHEGSYIGADTRTVNIIKHQLLDESPKTDEGNEISLPLPDGNFVTVAKNLGDKMHNAMFDPNLIGQDKVEGIYQTISKSILDCEDFLRSQMFGNIALAGGNTLGKESRQRLKDELSSATINPVFIEIPKKRDQAAWVGGSAVASLSTFNENCISRELWEEAGMSVVYRTIF
jgi:actin